MLVNKVQQTFANVYNQSFYGGGVKKAELSESKGCDRKYLYGSLAGLALVAIGAGAYKMRHGGAKKLSQEIQTIYRNGKVVVPSGEPYSGVVNRTGNSGALSMFCESGEIVKTVYTPKNSKNIKTITREFDTKTSDGVKIYKKQIEMQNGDVKVENFAEFTVKEFPPELESVIKMKDFDELGPRVVSKYSDLVMDYQGIYDLGNDYRLYVSTRANAYIYNGKSKMLRTSNGNSVSIIDSNNSLCTIKRDDNGKFQNLVIKNKHGIPIKFLNA